MRFVLGLIFSVLALNVCAKTIKGKDIDGATNEPLIGATVLLEGTSTGTATDINGAYFCGGFIKVNTKNIPENNAFAVSIGGTINEKMHFRNFLSAKVWAVSPCSRNGVNNAG